MYRGKQRLLELLAEAHSNELALINTLEAHIRIAERGSYKSLLQEHLRETKSHAAQVKRRLDRIGYTESLIARGYGLAQNLVKQGLVLTKGPIDLVRGGSDVKEKMLRNAMDEVMTEGMEIATYDTIETVARGLGDHDTAELAAAIRFEEERMFEALRKEITILADLVVQTTLIEGDHQIDVPWDGYDDMTVDEIKARLSDASTSLLIAVCNYEKANKDRSTVIEATEKETITA